MEHRNIFKYYNESTWQEREAIALELKRYYNTLLAQERELYRMHGNAVTYAETIAKVAALQGAFEIMHIDYEIDTPFEGV